MDCTPASGAFVADGDRWRFAGALTFDDASTVLASAGALPLPPSGIVDLTDLAQADSSALAVLLALRRRALAEGHRALAFTGVPPTLDALARVYGIEAYIVTPDAPVPG